MLLLVHSVGRCISPSPSLFPSPFLIPPAFFRNMEPPPSLDTDHEKIPDDDTPESGRLKTINIKPPKPITYRNCLKY